jgi:hypothetical protein
MFARTLRVMDFMRRRYNEISRALMRRMPRAANAAAYFVPILLAGCAASSCGWGRPLRARGKQIFPELCEGSDWTAGARPSRQGLDDATCAALEALWLHDAQKEHASVPAFARISWMLAAVGAPADLMAWAHGAALQEVDHAQRCFALAAGYGGRSHSVEPLPELLLSGLELDGDPLQTIMRESLEDGCQLEEFNADVAADAALHCAEPVTRAVLEQIAREEASHAALSWALLEWALTRAPETGRRALLVAEQQLRQVKRPVAVSDHLAQVVGRADPEQLRRHGRVPDVQLGTLWQQRLGQTILRLKKLSASLDSVATEAVARDRMAEVGY